MAEEPSSTPEPAERPVRRRASRAAGPASPDATVTAVTVPAPADGDSAVAVPIRSVEWPVASSVSTPPLRRQPHASLVALVSAAAVVLMLVVVGGIAALMAYQQRDADAIADRERLFVDTASQTVVNMFTYSPDTIEDSVDLFVAGTSGPLRDMLSQNDNVANLKELFRQTSATSEAVINAAALEDIDEVRNDASVLVAARVTVTDIDGVNKPSQAYRLRVIVHEDDQGRMTAWDLKYPDGGN